MRNINKVFGNSVWLIVAKIINIVIGLVVSVSITRYLGTENKGIMANVQAIATFWGFFASFGLADILISRFSKDKDISGKVAISGIVIMLCGGCIAFLLSICSAVILNVERLVVIYIAIYSSVYFFQFFSVFEYWFYSNSISKYYAIAQSIIYIVFLGIKFLGIPLGANLSYFIVVTSLETISLLVSLFFCYKKSKCFFCGSLQFDKNITKDIVVMAFPMAVMGFATTIYMKIDQIMVGKLIGNVELGLYSVAVSLAEYWYFIPGIIYSSFLPFIASSSGDEYKVRLQKFADIMVGLGYFAAIGVMFLGEWGISFLYGEEFGKSAYILMVYIWSGVFTCLSYSGQAVYIINKDTKTVMWINILGAILNFVLNALLISWIGSIGAAIATLVEYAIVAFGQMIILWKKYSELYIIQMKALFPFKRLFMYVYEYRIRR